MGSWLTCKCGARLHRNLFSGTGMSLIATEAFLDIDRAGATADDLVAELVRDGERLLRCSACRRIVLLQERPIDRVRFYMPDD